MRWSDEEERETIRPELDPAIVIDFHGAKIASDTGLLLLRSGFIGTNSRLAAGKVVKVYNGRGDKVRKHTLRCDKTSCHRFAANEARVHMGGLAYNLPHMLRQFCLLDGRGQAGSGIAHQASDRGWSQRRGPWSEVGSPCGVGLPLGWILQRCVRVTTATGKIDDGVSEGYVSSETAPKGPFHHQDDGLASFRSRGTPHGGVREAAGPLFCRRRVPRQSRWLDRRIIPAYESFEKGMKRMVPGTRE